MILAKEYHNSVTKVINKTSNYQPMSYQICTRIIFTGFLFIVISIE